MQCQLCSAVQDYLMGNTTLVQQFHSGWQYRSEEERAAEMSKLVSELTKVLEFPWP